MTTPPSVAPDLKLLDMQGRHLQPRPLTTLKTNPPGEQSLDIERAVFDGVAAGNCAVMVTDHTKADEPIAYVNHAFENMTGYKLAELIGVPAPFLENSDQPGVKEIETAIRSGKPCSAIVSDCHNKKNRSWYQIDLSPVFSENGRLTHFFGSLKDITSSMDEAETEAAREAFLATVAHDLRTPLAGADRMFALITEGLLGNVSADLQQTLGLLSKGNRRALDLVVNVLESYRLRKGSNLLHFEAVDLSALIEGAVDEVEAAILPRRLKIKTVISQNFPICNLDRLSITRLLTNLLDNAVKFTPEGGSVQISAEVLDGDVLLKVTDTGGGMAAEDKICLFDKIKPARKHRYMPGCGLGLNICKQVTTAHKGKIYVESAIGVGTTFTVILPINASL